MRIDLSVAIAHLHIIPALPKFITQYPDLKLNISLSDRMADIVEEGIDATVRVGMGHDSSLIMRTVGIVRFITCAAPDYLRRYGEPLTPQDLMQHRCISFVYPQTRRDFEWRFKFEKQELRIAVDSQFKFDDAEAILDAAIRGVGIIQHPNYIVGRSIQRGELQAILSNYQSNESLPIAVLYPQKRFLSAKVCVFVDFIVELMAQFRDDGIVD